MDSTITKTENTQKIVKKSDKIGENKELTKDPIRGRKRAKISSLCWTCECALCTPEHSCEWSKDFKPVPNWTLQEGVFFPSGETATVVLTCPKYVSHFQYTTPQEIAEEVCKTLPVKTYAYRADPLRYCVRYEKKTGKKLPQWYFDYLEKLRKKAERKKKT